MTPIFKEYVSYLNKYKEKYGDQTVVLMQVGSFYEIYAILNDTDKLGEEVVSPEVEQRPPSTENTEWHYIEKKKEEKNKFEGMKMYKHGRGYLLTCDENHHDWGEKYYYNAWWQNCNYGWFLKREHKDFFLDNGAEFIFE